MQKDIDRLFGPRDPAKTAMRHEGIFQEMAVRAIQFVTTHADVGVIRWTNDSHYHPKTDMWRLTENDRCSCCWGRINFNSSPCEYCTTAWRLSAISTAVFTSVKQNGLSIPRGWRKWTTEERNANLGQPCKTTSQGWKGGYEPHEESVSVPGQYQGVAGRWVFPPDDEEQPEVVYFEPDPCDTDHPWKTADPWSTWKDPSSSHNDTILINGYEPQLQGASGSTTLFGAPPPGHQQQQQPKGEEKTLKKSALDKTTIEVFRVLSEQVAMHDNQAAFAEPAPPTANKEDDAKPFASPFS